MPKRVPPLTVKKIASAKPGERLFDGNGLRLLVDANGNKRWELRYTRPDGRANNIGLGSFPNVSLELARRRAQEYRENIIDGIDPVEAKRKSKREIKAIARDTFKAVGEE